MSKHPHCSKCSKHHRGGRFWCCSCASYQHVKFNGLSARRKHHENIRCVICETKATVISSVATFLYHAATIARDRTLLGKPVLKQAVTGLTSIKAKKAYEEHVETSCSLECNLIYAAKKQNRPYVHR